MTNEYRLAVNKFSTLRYYKESLRRAQARVVYFENNTVTYSEIQQIQDSIDLYACNILQYELSCYLLYHYTHRADPD